MTYNYNGNLSFEERVGIITKELMDEYNIEKETALKIASIEEPITSNDLYDSMFKRFSNILRINKDEKINNKVIDDMFIYYNDIKGKNSKIDNYMNDIEIYIKYNTSIPEYK